MAALGAATRWAIEQLAISTEETNLSEPVPLVQVTDWNLSPSVGTWLLLKPKQVAPQPSVALVSATKTSTPSKVKPGGAGKGPAKALSPKVEVRRSPRRTVPPTFAPTAKGKDQTVREAVAQPAAETSKPSLASAKISSKSSSTVPAQRAVQKENIRQPQQPQKSSKPAKEANAVAPQVRDAASKKTMVKPEGSVPPCEAAPAPSLEAPRAKSPAAPPAKSPPAIRAKSPAALRAKSQRSLPDGGRPDTIAPAGSKAKSSAEIEAQQIEEKRKQAKLLAEKNARRMVRSASAKAVKASPAVAAPTETQPAKCLAPKAQPRQLSPEAPTACEAAQAFVKVGSGAAARAKIVAAAPTPAKNTSSSPRPVKPVRADAASLGATKGASPSCVRLGSEVKVASVSQVSDTAAQAARHKPMASGSKATLATSPRTLMAGAATGKLTRKPSPARCAQKPVQSTTTGKD